jgi:vitamin B12 transporter
MHILKLSAYLASTVLVVAPLDVFAQTKASVQDGVVLDTIVVTP